jgi:hypothetical protein
MSFDSTWPTADPDAVGNVDNGEPPEPGFYDVVLIDASALTSKKNEDWVILKWQILGTDHDWPQVLGFRSEAAANFTKREVRELGVNVDQIGSLDELDTALRTQVAKFFRVEVVQNGDFRNTYIRGAANSTSDIPVDPGDFAPVTAGVPDEDIPF